MCGPVFQHGVTTILISSSFAKSKTNAFWLISVLPGNENFEEFTMNHAVVRDHCINFPPFFTAQIFPFQ